MIRPQLSLHTVHIHTRALLQNKQRGGSTHRRCGAGSPRCWACSRSVWGVAGCIWNGMDCRLPCVCGPLPRCRLGSPCVNAHRHAQSHTHTHTRTHARTRTRTRTRTSTHTHTNRVSLGCSPGRENLSFPSAMDVHFTQDYTRRRNKNHVKGHMVHIRSMSVNLSFPSATDIHFTQVDTH